MYIILYLKFYLLFITIYNLLIGILRTEKDCSLLWCVLVVVSWCVLLFCGLWFVLFLCLFVQFNIGVYTVFCVYAVVYTVTFFVMCC